LSWDPDVSGAKRKATRAADAAYQASQSDLRNTQVSLAAEVALDYLQLRSYEVRLGIARRNEASQSETLQLVEWRNQAGLASSVEVEQARANRDQTRAQIPTLEASLAQAQHTLELLVGVEPGSLTAELARSSTIPSPPDELAIGIPADALRQRPDVRAAEQRVAEQNAQVAQQRAARYPTVSLAASLGWQALGGVLTGGASTLRSLSSGFTQTVYDGGRIRQNIAIQSALQEQAVVNYESTVLKALKEVENAILAFAKNGERLAALSTAAEAARNAAQLAQNRYAAGLIDFQTVLDTQRTVLNLEDSVATTQADRTTAVVQLYQAMGGGWSETPAGSATGKGKQP
jgi:NodT family efflux transporter outer membrane factor (OMF) lipoprotein